MFGRALKRNSSIEKVVIINPDPGRIISLLTEEFGIKQSMLEIKQERFQVPLTKAKPIL